MNRIDDHLTWSSTGMLQIENCSIEDIARRFGTPLFLVSEAKLRMNVRRYFAAFRKVWPDGEVQILPAIKANYISALWHILREEGCGCDTFSEGELWQALRMGIASNLISLNGSSKLGPSGERMLRHAIDVGVPITVDTIQELSAIDAAAESVGRSAVIRLRLRPSSEGMDRFQNEITGGRISSAESLANYRPGLPLDLVESATRLALRSKHLRLVGVHLHAGRANSHPEYLAQIMHAYGTLIGRIQDVTGWEPSVIDIGGGIPTSRDPVGRRNAALNGDDKTGFDPAIDLRPSLESYAMTIVGSLRTALTEQGIVTADKILQVEPGRGLFSSAGLHLTRVTFLKQQRQPMNRTWVNLDTSEIFLSGIKDESALFRYLPVRRDKLPTPDNRRFVDLVGTSCNPDRLVPNAVVSDALAADDFLVFLDTGAYEETLSSNFNALPRPATVLVRGGDAALIKRAESIEEVFARDQIPFWLA